MPHALPPMVRGRVIPVPDRVVHARPTASSWELLVRWQGHDAAEASWVPLEQFKEEFQDFQHEDELFRQAGEVFWSPPLGPSILGGLRSQLRNSISVN
jgi:hypothetical protein